MADEPKVRFRDTVAGVDREYTLEEAAERLKEFAISAEKLRGADEKFRQAAEMRKQAEQQQGQLEEALALKEALGKIGEGDTDSFIKVASELGFNDTKSAQKFWDMLYQGGGEETIVPNPKPRAGSDAPATGETRLPISLRDLPEEVLEAAALVQRLKKAGIDPEKTLTHSHNLVESTAEDRASQFVREAIMKHPVLGRVARTQGAEGTNVLVEEALGKLRSMVADGKKTLTQARQEAVASVASLVTLGGEKPDETELTGLFGAGASPVAPRSALTPKDRPQLTADTLAEEGNLSKFIDAGMAFDDTLGQQQADETL